VNKARHPFLLRDPTPLPPQRGERRQPRTCPGTALGAACGAKRFSQPQPQPCGRSAVFLPTDQLLPARRRHWKPGRAQPPQKLQDLCPAPCSAVPSAPKTPPESRWVPAGLPQAQTGIIRRSEQGESPGKSPTPHVSFTLLGHPASFQPAAPPATFPLSKFPGCPRSGYLAQRAQEQTPTSALGLCRK